MNWPKYTYILSLLSLPATHPPSHPSRLLQSNRLSSLLYGSFPLASYFTLGSEYTSVLQSPSSTVPTSLLSVSASVFLPCKQAHHFTIFLDCIYMP